MPNDIYGINGRIKNLVAKEDLGLTAAGIAMINSHTMLLFELHEFALKLPKPFGENLTALLLTKESMPANLIKRYTPKPDDKEYKLPAAMGICGKQDSLEDDPTVIIEDFNRQLSIEVSMDEAKAMAIRLMELYKAVNHES